MQLTQQRSIPRSAPDGAACRSDENGDFVERQACPACDAGGSIPVLSVPFASPLVAGYMGRHYEARANLGLLADRTFEVVRCRSCGLLYQPLAPAGRLMQAIYDEWIPPIDQSAIYREDRLADSRYRIEQVDFLIQCVGRPPGSIRFLDYGNGWSEWLFVARAFGCKVAGFELSLHRQRFARANGIAMLSSEELSRQRFDLINLEQVLEHLVKPAETLALLAASLAPGGVMRIAVPNGHRMLGRLRRLSPSQEVAPGYLMPVQPLEHLNCFTHRTLTTLAERAGLVRVNPSLRQLYDSVAGWASLSGAGHNLVRPIYRHVWPRSTNMFFRTRVH